MTYDVFISYAQSADSEVAEGLCQALARYAKPWWRRRATNVFLDRSVLSANPSIWSSITNAMDQSQWLILLASPEAAKSEWVNREVGYWIDHRGLDHLMVALTGGHCKWDAHRGRYDDDSDAIPPALLSRLTAEPFYVDLTSVRASSELSLQNARFREQVAKLAAPVRGLSRDDLDALDLLEHRKTRRTVFAVAIAFALLFLVSAVAGLFAVHQRDVARARTADSDFERIESQSTNLLSTNPSLGLLLAVEAREIRDNATSRSTLLSALQSQRGYLGEIPTAAQPTDVAVLKNGVVAYATHNASLGFETIQNGSQRGRLLQLGRRGTQITIRIAQDSSRGSADPLVVARFDTGQIWRINPQTYRPIGRPIDIRSPIFSVAASQRLDMIAVAKAGGTVELLGMNGTVLNTIPPPATAPDPYLIPPKAARSFYGAGNVRMTATDVEALAFSPETPELAIERIGGVERVELATDSTSFLNLENTISAPPSINESLAYGGGGLLLVSEPTSVTQNAGQGLEQLEMFDLATGAALWSEDTETGLSLFASDGKTLEVIDSAGNIISIDPLSGRTVRTIFTLNEAADGVSAIQSEGELVLASAAHPHLTVVSDSNASPIMRVLGRPGQSPDGFSPNGRTLLVESGSGFPYKLSLWDPLNDRPILPIISSAAIGALGPDNTLTAIFDNGTAGTIDLRTSRRVGPLISLNPTGLYSDAASPDGTLLALGRFNGSVDVYRYEDGRPKTIHVGGPVGVNVSSQGVLLAGVQGESASLYRVDTGTRIATVGQLSASAFSQDGRTLVVGTLSGQLRLVDTSNGHPIGPAFPRIPVGIGGAQWSAAVIGTQDNAGRIRLYDPTSGEQIGSYFSAIDDNSGDWSLNPAGTMLALKESDGVELWDLNPNDWQRAACQLAGRNLSAEEWRTYLSNIRPYTRTCTQWPAGSRQ
jgi:WD40 repeat protein